MCEGKVVKQFLYANELLPLVKHIGPDGYMEDTAMLI